MRCVFNAIFFCLFAVLALKLDAQTVNQGVNWDSALSSCSSERDISDDLAAKVRSMNYGHRDSKEVIDDIKRWYPSDSQLIDRLDKAILHYQGEVERYKGAVDRVRNDKNFYLPTAANLANSELYLCLFRAGLRQVRQSVSSPSAQQQAPIRSGNQQDSARIDINQTIALAQQNQAQGDEQARKKGRREHRPDLDAKECLQLNPNTRLIRNACSYQIEVSYCAHNPKQANNDNSDVTWAFSCTEGKGRFGASTLRPGKDLGGMFPHRADGGIYVAACREVYPKDIKFTGNQIDYRCRPI
jgi:hypothetical protein